MSLETKMRDLITRLGTEFKKVYGITGDKANLQTADKSSLVAALNELKGLIGNASGINDAAPSAGSTYSSQKIEQQISAAIAALVNGAPTALDTLKELADALAADDSDIAALVTSLDNRLRVDAPQALSVAQRQQGRDNLDVYSKAEVGDVNRDFVADFNLALQG